MKNKISILTFYILIILIVGSFAVHYDSTMIMPVMFALVFGARYIANKKEAEG